jgi:hypothetical protein
MRSRVSIATLDIPRNDLDTVVAETPAIRATSRMVAAGIR